LRLNFITNFDWKICLIIILLASFGKIAGGYIGARLSGFKINKAWAMGFSMNIYGSQQIALGSIALQAKIIDERIFVALVVMTFVTIMTAGPSIKYFLRRHEQVVGISEELIADTATQPELQPIIQSQRPI
jgi:K+:H+ antiporter